jgi:hypothetical protein
MQTQRNGNEVVRAKVFTQEQAPESNLESIPHGRMKTSELTSGHQIAFLHIA